MAFGRRIRNARRLYSQLWSLKEEFAALQEGQLQLLRAVESLQDREYELREKLWLLRATHSYGQAFTDEEPLVSVTIPTWTNHSALAEIALPSVLNQTYRNFEVVVVGDAAPEETARVVASFDDPRIKYANLPYRGPYPDDPMRRWFVAGVPAINEAARLARGAWLAPQNDDDTFTPDHLELLLAAARKSRSEVVYGRFEIAIEGREPFMAGTFPPTRGEFTWQAALYHSGLRFFEMELGDAWFDRPGDWSLCRRMLTAGVRMTMIDDIVAHLYPAATAQVEAEERR